MTTALEASDTEVIDKRKHREALKRVEKMRAKRDAESATLERTFVRDADKANACSSSPPTRPP